MAKWEKRTGYFMLALAVFVSITGIATSIYYIVHGQAAEQTIASQA